jgi:hypothetical protein
MAMGMRLGAGGVPMLPFAGDPNEVGGPVPPQGLLFDTVSGVVYVGDGFFWKPADDTIVTDDNFNALFTEAGEVIYA